jgi:hypothetical protein
MPKLASLAEEVFPHGCVETETEDEITSDENLDDLQMDLKCESEQTVRVKLTSHDLKHRESDEPPTEYSLVPLPEPERVSSIRICRPKKLIGVDMKSPNYTTACPTYP